MKIEEAAVNHECHGKAQWEHNRRHKPGAHVHTPLQSLRLSAPFGAAAQMPKNRGYSGEFARYPTRDLGPRRVNHTLSVAQNYARQTNPLRFYMASLSLHSMYVEFIDARFGTKSLI